jgi:protease YdgD
MAVGLLRRLALLAVLCGATPAFATGDAEHALPFTTNAYHFSVHREDVDVSRQPWSAIGALYNGTGSSCTGVVVARDKVVTAAHCIYNDRTQRFVPPESLHFLSGYRSGRYLAHGRVAGYEIGSGYDPLHYGQTIGADWAVLTLVESLPDEIVPLRLSHRPFATGARAAIAGYRQDRRHAMTADRDCELGDSTRFGQLVLHTCEGSRGYSGAPILVRDTDGAFEVAGIHIASYRSGNEKMLAVPADAILRQSASLAVPAETQLADLATGERVPVVSGQDDVGERTARLLQVVVEARRDRLPNIEIDLARNVADDRRRSLRGLDEDALMAGRVGVGIEHALNPRERIAIAFNQLHAIP